MASAAYFDASFYHNELITIYYIVHTLMCICIKVTHITASAVYHKCVFLLQGTYDGFCCLLQCVLLLQGTYNNTYPAHFDVYFHHS